MDRPLQQARPRGPERTSLPRETLLEGCARAQELAGVLEAAERALRTWEPVWTEFLDAELREEAESRLGALSELSVLGWGGHPGAERQRLLLQRMETARPLVEHPEVLGGLEVGGNFLFDPATPMDVEAGLLAVDAPRGSLGDLWLRGDRGGQVIVTRDLAERLDGCSAQVRSVPVELEARPLEELQFPQQRVPRSLRTVEASLRLDAVASAGFGLSRQRMADRIREGRVRVNWQTTTRPSRDLAVGDRIRLEGRGELRIEAVHPTKRGRLRIEMVRR